MVEKKFNKKTLPESIKIHNTIKERSEVVEAEDCLGAIKTFDDTEKTCVQCKEVIQTYYNDTYEQVTMFPDGNGGTVSANGQIAQPAQPIGYNLHPRKLMRFIRDHSTLSSCGNDIIISIEPGYEYLLDILSVSLQLDHEKISNQYASGTLHADLKPYIFDAPVQLQIGVAHVKKGGNS